jgi:nucleotide-binding universal stress UspA family protein
MYQNILVATGGSPWSNAAVAYATAIAARTGATLRVLTVLVNPGIYANPDVLGGTEFVVDIVEKDGQELLARIADQAAQAGVRCETFCRWGGVPETILHTAQEVSSDLIVLGSRLLSGWKRLRLGQIANAVSAKAEQPVLVVKRPPQVAPGSPLGRRLLVATGGSPWSDMAVDYAIDVARRERLSLCLLHVVPGRHRLWGREADDTEGRHLLARAETRAIDAGVATTAVLEHGDVRSKIVATADKQHCDGIILGARAAAGWKRMMIGDISNAVTVTTPLPVLIVKGSSNLLGE